MSNLNNIRLFKDKMNSLYVIIGLLILIITLENILLIRTFNQIGFYETGYLPDGEKK